MRRAVTYARYSTDLQSPTSIQDQIRLCEQNAPRHEVTVVNTYQDAAISGATDQRPGYQALLRDALSTPPLFNVIICESLDRLTRDPAEMHTLYRRLRLNGVDIIGVSDGVDTRRKGAALHVAVSGLKNSLFLDDLSEKTHRGLAGRLERGLTAGGRCYGYRVVDGRLTPAEATAAVVRRLWSEYAQGRSFRKIAHRLNADHVPFPSQDTTRGSARKGWTASSVRTILINDIYCGRLVWNRSQFLKDPDTGRRRRMPRPPDQWHVQERPELRIIPPELERAVKARLAFVRETYGPRARQRDDGKWVPVGRAAAAYPRCC